jgi:hypothetical protein
MMSYEGCQTKNEAIIMNKSEENITQQVIDALNANSYTLDASVANRLKNARKAALNHHASRTRSAHGSVLAIAGNYLQQYQFAFAGLAACSLLVLTLMPAPQSPARSNPLVLSSETNDAYLLGAELPPEAFADGGFQSWVEHS